MAVVATFDLILCLIEQTQGLLFHHHALTTPGSNSTPGLRIAGVVFSVVSVGIPILLISFGLCFLLYGDVCISSAKEWLTLCGCLSRAKEWLTEAWENRQVTKGWCGISHISGYSGTSIF